MSRKPLVQLLKKDKQKIIHGYNFNYRNQLEGMAKVTCNLEHDAK